MRFRLVIATVLCALVGGCGASTYITGQIDNQQGRDKANTYMQLVDEATRPLGFKPSGFDYDTDSFFFKGPNKIEIQVIDNTVLRIYITDPAGTCRSDTDVQVIEAIQDRFRAKYGVNVTFRCSKKGSK